MVIFKKETEVISNYLLNIVPKEKSRKLYKKGLEELRIVLSKKEERIFLFALRYPFFLPYIDAALAIKRPKSAIRGRIYLMLAILETEPAHVKEFIYYDDKEGKFGWFFKVSFYSLRALWRSAFGLFIILWI